MPQDPSGLPDLLLKEYQGLVAQVRRAWRLDEEGAMDLVHDTIVRVYESIGTYDPSKGEFRGWLWGVLKHAAVRKPQPRLRPEEAEDVRPLEDLVGEEIVKFLQASVGALPDAYRKTVELRYYQGMDLAAIAKELGVPLGTVKARLSRAPEMLKQSMTVQATTARMFLERMKKKRR